MPIDLTRPEPGVALVTIDNPLRRNALGPAEFHGLAQAWSRLELDPSVRCIVVTGRGTVAFCSGAQLDADFAAVADADAMVDAALLKTRLMHKPVVAAVNGHCVAGGFELMMASDIRVASDAARLGLPEVHWGILPSGGAAMKLIEQIGHARAMQLLLTADLIPAERAREYGLVNEVVPADQVLETAMAIARRVAGNSPLAVAMTKESALKWRAASWAALEAEERERAVRVRSSADNRIGRKAFLTKTEPLYPPY